MTFDPKTHLRCPLDAGHLHWDEAGITCLKCDRTWPRHGDIPVFGPTLEVPEGDDDASAGPSPRRSAKGAASAAAPSAASAAAPAGRHDWRFLLPSGDDVRVLELESPGHRASLDLAPDVAECLVVTPSERRALELRHEAAVEQRDAVAPLVAPFDTLPFANGAFDAVIAHDWVQRMQGASLGRRLSFLRRLRAKTAPGGALWFELQVPSSLLSRWAVPALRRQLAAAGWTATEFFALPAPHRPFEMNPLDDPTAERWHEGAPSTTVVTQLFTQATRKLGYLPRGVRRLGVLAVRPGRSLRPQPPRSILAETSRRLREAWPTLGVDEAAPARLRYWLDGRDASPHGAMSALPFRPGETEPLAHVSIARDGTSALRLRHEFDVLRDLEAEAPKAAGRLFPRAHFIAETSAATATVRSLLPGAPILAHAPWEESLGAAQHWLAQLWKATGFLTGTERALWEELLRDVHATIEAEPDDERRSRFSDLAQDLRARSGVAIASFGHGSFRREQLRKDGPHVGGLDFRAARSRQFPWLDGVEFVLDLCLEQADVSDRPLSEVLTAVFDFSTPAETTEFARARKFLQWLLEESAASLDVLDLAVPAVALSLSRRASRFEAKSQIASRWRAAAFDRLSPGTRGAPPRGVLPPFRAKQSI